MPIFNLTPNLRILNRYLTSATDADFDAENNNYQPESIEIVIDWDVFSNEEAFVHAFKELLTKYQLVNHYDNLLYLTVYVYDIVLQEIQLRYDQYESKKRARELAQLLLVLKGTRNKKLSGISFKSMTETAKVTDSVTAEWISETLITALESKKFPIAKFGTNVLEILTNEGQPFDYEPANLEKLQHYIKARLVNPKSSIRKGTATICIVILTYLEGETELRTDESVSLSDKQLNFLFELLELLKQLDRLLIDSEPKDYLRTLILNQLKSL